ncbi:uncharacterized protein EI90DRAFT_3145553 [Cantharellus anzutake]|uniref:uncharacterized protein n=1 Tax=Cantharellus anzutake TaxID=1750568 RepID=UPI001906A529|nr:uncharacterized protein EI90DRAFT_3145553 [Cantharellus anzutake]KAF8332088.1 hypothetical protein EI90DRAFT_3145553 [Cantharellus anzutake]
MSDLTLNSIWEPISGSDDKLVRLDWSERVPGYEWEDPRPWLLEAVRNGLIAPSGPVLVAIESIDNLSQDIGSVSQTYIFLRSLLALVVERPNPSRLIITLSSSSPLLPQLIPPSFSSTLTSVALHSPILIRHLAESYLTYPPPLCPPEKFWAMFSPAVARGESDQLAFSGIATQILGKGIAYDGRDPFSGIADVTIRGPSVSASARGSSRVHRAVERSLEGWMFDHESGNVKNIPWDQLPILQNMRSHTKVIGEGKVAGEHRDMNTLSFNLSLTDAQAAARAEVPLPYAHEGKIPEGQGQIIYDPDSADDLDDDDPDEDLDI